MGFLFRWLAIDNINAWCNSYKAAHIYIYTLTVAIVMMMESPVGMRYELWSHTSCCEVYCGWWGRSLWCVVGHRCHRWRCLEHGFRLGLGSRIFPSSVLFCCVADLSSSKRCTPVMRATRHFDLLQTTFFQSFWWMVVDGMLALRWSDCSGRPWDLEPDCSSESKTAFGHCAHGRAVKSPMIRASVPLLYLVALLLNVDVGGMVVCGRMWDLQSRGHQFSSQPFLFYVTTLGKSFTHASVTLGCCNIIDAVKCLSLPAMLSYCWSNVKNGILPLKIPLHHGFAKISMEQICDTENRRIKQKSKSILMHLCTGLTCALKLGCITSRQRTTTTLWVSCAALAMHSVWFLAAWRSSTTCCSQSVAPSTARKICGREWSAGFTAPTVSRSLRCWRHAASDSSLNVDEISWRLVLLP